MQLIYNYRFDSSRATKLTCPVIALDGSEGDQLIADHELAAWSEYTTGAFRSYRFAGGHFFIDSAAPAVLAVVKNELAPFLR